MTTAAFAPPAWGQLTIQPGQLNEQQLEPTDEAVYTIPVRNDFNSRAANLTPTVTFASSPPFIRITGVEVKCPLGASILLPGAVADLLVSIKTVNAPPGNYAMDITVGCTILPMSDFDPVSGSQSVTVSPD